MKNKDTFYAEGLSFSDKLNFIADKLETVRNRLEDIADDMDQEDLLSS